MDIEILLNFNYEHLKNYLLNSSIDERKKVLSDDRIKNKLINSDYKYDFVFLSQEDSDILVYLLNGNGIEILKNNSNYDIFLNSILTSGKKYVDKLFDNKDFTNLVLENINNSKVKFYYLNSSIANQLYNNVNNENKIVHDTESDNAFQSALRRGFYRRIAGIRRPYDGFRADYGCRRMRFLRRFRRTGSQTAVGNRRATRFAGGHGVVRYRSGCGVLHAVRILPECGR